MTYKTLKEKLDFLVYGENAWRLLAARLDGDGTPVVRIDVHGLKVAEAKKLVRDIATIVMVRMDLVVIHGYHHGTAIKDMLVVEEFNSRLAARYCPDYNAGLTVMTFAA